MTTVSGLAVGAPSAAPVKEAKRSSMAREMRALISVQGVGGRRGRSASVQGMEGDTTPRACAADSAPGTREIASAGEEAELVASVAASESEVEADAAVSEEVVAEAGAARKEGPRALVTHEHVVQMEEHVGHVEAQLAHLFDASEQVLGAVQVLELEKQALKREKQEAQQAVGELQHQRDVARALVRVLRVTSAAPACCSCEMTRQVYPRVSQIRC